MYKKPTQEQLSKHTDWIDKTHFVSSQALCIMSKYNVSIMLKSLRAANGQMENLAIVKLKNETLQLV